LGTHSNHSTGSRARFQELAPVTTSGCFQARQAVVRRWGGRERQGSGELCRTLNYTFPWYSIDLHFLKV
jgi:hypothetical protein